MMSMSVVPATKPVTVSAKSTYVYITASGKGTEYHSSKKCRTLKRSRIKKSNSRIPKNQAIKNVKFVTKNGSVN